MGSAVAVSISASIVSATVAGYRRGEVVELARLGRDPLVPWVLRPMLRIWRSVFAPRWRCWPVRAAVSYALPGTAGALYRFDGWRRVGRCRPWAGGATWSQPARVNDVGDGVKTLWVFDLDNEAPQ